SRAVLGGPGTARDGEPAEREGEHDLRERGHRRAGEAQPARRVRAGRVRRDERRGSLEPDVRGEQGGDRDLRHDREGEARERRAAPEHEGPGLGDDQCEDRRPHARREDRLAGPGAERRADVRREDALDPEEQRDGHRRDDGGEHGVAAGRRPHARAVEQAAQGLGHGLLLAVRGRGPAHPKVRGPARSDEVGRDQTRSRRRNVTDPLPSTTTTHAVSPASAASVPSGAAPPSSAAPDWPVDASAPSPSGSHSAAADSPPDRSVTAPRTTGSASARAATVTTAATWPRTSVPIPRPSQARRTSTTRPRAQIPRTSPGPSARVAPGVVTIATSRPRAPRSARTTPTPSATVAVAPALAARTRSRDGWT